MNDTIRRETFYTPPTPAELASYHLNDYGNAMRLIRLAGGTINEFGDIDVSNVRLLYQLGQGWVGYNGRHWDRDFGDQLARRLTHQVGIKMQEIKNELVKKSGAADGSLTKFIDGCGSSGACSAMLKQAESYLAVEIDVFDQHPMAINCANGTVWLKPTGSNDLKPTLRPHSPGDRITRFIDYNYDPDAKCPHFMATLNDSLRDPEVRDFFHRAHGYSLTAEVYEQAIFIHQGLGRDGKSTLLDAIRKTEGAYAGVGDVKTFLDLGQQSSGSASPDMVKLAGDVRMVVLSEPSRGQKLNEGLLKLWTSGSPVPARQLQQKSFDFLPVGKLHLECNAFPVARGDDDGIWRRMYPILFENQVPEDKQDRLLPRKLEAEKAGILNWLIEGVGEWLRRGLDPPPRVIQAREDYRKQSSPFGDWLNERCVWGKAAGQERTLSGILYNSYKDWAETQGHDKPMSQRAFGDALHQRQILGAGKDKDGRKYRRPIRLKTDVELRADNPEGWAESSGGLSFSASATPRGADDFNPDDVTW